MQVQSRNWSGIQPKRANILEAFTMLTRFLKDESGATAIEYALIAAAVGVGVATAMGTLGTSLDGVWKNVTDNVK
jgi:pilus assembly protein Flp/PilA